jgi:MoaA/NifB/PqqE/SkfB family radical SAM enzyme
MNEKVRDRALAFMKQRPEFAVYGRLLTAHPGTGYVSGQVELTSACFQSCAGCDSWRDHMKHGARSMSLENLDKLCERLAVMPDFNKLTLTGGDPQAWPHLDAFLSNRRWPFALQLTTALVKDPNVALWGETVDEIRVSLDALDPNIYKAIRGRSQPDAGFVHYLPGQITTPDEVINRACDLQHHGLSFFVVVYERNADDVARLLQALDELFINGELKCRRVHVVLGIGARGVAWREGKIGRAWATIRNLADHLDLPINVQDDEDVFNTREALENNPLGDYDDVRCHAGRISFHIKPNGDLYPCCLIGGEALEEIESFKVGNVFEDGIWECSQRYAPRCHYREPASVCRRVCQWKQFHVNCLGEYASTCAPSIP